MENTPVTIGIVDDHPVFRKGLNFFLKHHGNINVTLEAGNGKELQDALQKVAAPDMLLLDLSMPEMDGYETLSWLSVAYPNLPVIIFTGYETELMLDRLYLHGAKAVLHKSICEKELLKAIARVTEDGFYYNNPSARNMILKNQQDASSGKRTRLTLNEKEELFLRLASTNMTYQGIAGEMGISERAVDKVRRILFDKLDVQNRAALAVKAVVNCIAMIPETIRNVSGQKRA